MKQIGFVIFFTLIAYLSHAEPNGGAGTGGISATLSCQQRGPNVQLDDLSGFSVKTTGRKLSFRFTIPAHDPLFGKNARLHDSLIDRFPVLQSYVRSDHAYEISYDFEIPKDVYPIYCAPFSLDKVLGHCQLDKKSATMIVSDKTEAKAPMSFFTENIFFSTSRKIEDDGIHPPRIYVLVGTSLRGVQLQNDSTGSYPFDEEQCMVTGQ